MKREGKSIKGTGQLSFFSNQRDDSISRRSSPYILLLSFSWPELGHVTAVTSLATREPVQFGFSVGHCCYPERNQGIDLAVSAP